MNDFIVQVSINRRIRIPDNRVHCCLYFIAPTGHRLKPLDILVMKHLDKCVNVIPVIAKADTLTLEVFMSKLSFYSALNLHFGFPPQQIVLRPVRWRIFSVLKQL